MGTADADCDEDDEEVVERGESGMAADSFADLPRVLAVLMAELLSFLMRRSGNGPNDDEADEDEAEEDEEEATDSPDRRPASRCLPLRIPRRIYADFPLSV